MRNVVPAASTSVADALSNTGCGASDASAQPCAGATTARSGPPAITLSGTGGGSSSPTSDVGGAGVVVAGITGAVLVGGGRLDAGSAWPPHALASKIPATMPMRTARRSPAVISGNDR
jgi:hypothetical protein